jgi:hypothetical protein
MDARREVLCIKKKEYLKASKKMKGKIIDELVTLTGHNRSYASRVPRGSKASQRKAKANKQPPGARGRKIIYGPDISSSLLTIWKIMDFACGKRIHSGMPDIIGALIRFGEIQYDGDTIQKLLAVSPATIDRILKSERARFEIKGRSATKPGSLLKSQIPIRLGNEWGDARPGFIEIDLAAHSGSNARGEFINTLDATDISTGWCETRAVINKAQKHVFEALKEIRRRLPFPLLGVDSDNGSEFINDELLRWCREEGLVFTRSRPNKKNDGCHVEQKNWPVVRQNVGYKRYEGTEALGLMNELYDLLRLHTNFFMPSVKLLSKERNGSRILKRYSLPVTPYRRVLASENVDGETKLRVSRQFETLNPMELRRRIVSLQNRLAHLMNI